MFLFSMLCVLILIVYVQWTFYFVFWLGLLVLFQSQTSPARRRTSLDVSEPILMTALDDLFRPSTIAKQTLLNTLGVGWHHISGLCISLFSLLFLDPGRINFHRADQLPSWLWSSEEQQDGREILELPQPPPTDSILEASGFF